MALTPEQAIVVAKDQMWPMLRHERERVAHLDRWLRWDHEPPHSPRHSTREYRELSERSQAPWGRRVVSAVTDQLYVEGYRSPGQGDESPSWSWWQANRLDSRQIAIHEATVGYGIAHVVVLPGKDPLTGASMPVIRGLDPSQMVAAYADPAWDDWPVYAMRAEPIQVGDRQSFRLHLYDEKYRHVLLMTESGGTVTYQRSEEHNAGVCPVVRFTNHLDLRGRASGDVEPIIPLLGRIDQTAFDRLVVQRFGAWVVRTISGMSKPDSDSEAAAQRLILKVEDLLVAEDPDTKFGTLAATNMAPFIEAHDADVRALAALSQSPAHELIGQMANLSAEALAAAEASLTRRVVRVQHPVGESWEQVMRLSGAVMGDAEAASDVAAEVVWRDMESRSMAQAADALGKAATMLGIPVELLWGKLPGFTQQDVEEAKRIIESRGDLEAVLAQLANAGAPNELAPPAA